MNILRHARKWQQLINKITYCIFQNKTCYKTSVLVMEEEERDREIVKGFSEPQSGVDILSLFTFHLPELVTCPVSFWSQGMCYSYTQSRAARCST